MQQGEQGGRSLWSFMGAGAAPILLCRSDNDGNVNEKDNEERNKADNSSQGTSAMTVIRGGSETRNGNYGQSGAGVEVSERCPFLCYGSHDTNLTQN